MRGALRGLSGNGAADCLSAADLSYLANLCHNCGACYHHCQYAPPHEFAVNVPKTFAELRMQTYGDYAWPGFLAGLFARNALATTLITAGGVMLFVLATVLLVEPAALFGSHLGEGAFYAIIPHDVMGGIFVAVSAIVLAAFVIGSAGSGGTRARELSPSRRRSGRPYRTCLASDICKAAPATAARIRGRRHRRRAAGSTI